MIEVANNEAAVSEFGEPMQQRHGVTSAGNADEIAAGRRILGDDVRIEREFLLGRRLHAIQQATRLDSRQDIKERRFSIAVF